MYITPNGAGHRPEIEDVWGYDEPSNRPVMNKKRFISEFITYANKRNEVRNQALAEIEYNYDENI